MKRKIILFSLFVFLLLPGLLRAGEVVLNPVTNKKWKTLSLPLNCTNGLCKMGGDDFGVTYSGSSLLAVHLPFSISTSMEEIKAADQGVSKILHQGRAESHRTGAGRFSLGTEYSTSRQMGLEKRENLTQQKRQSFSFQRNWTTIFFNELTESSFHMPTRDEIDKDEYKAWEEYWFKPLLAVYNMYLDGNLPVLLYTWRVYHNLKSYFENNDMVELEKKIVFAKPTQAVRTAAYLLATGGNVLEAAMLQTGYLVVTPDIDTLIRDARTYYKSGRTMLLTAAEQAAPRIVEEYTPCIQQVAERRLKQIKEELHGKSERGINSYFLLYINPLSEDTLGSFRVTEYATPAEMKKVMTEFRAWSMELKSAARRTMERLKKGKWKSMLHPRKRKAG